MRRPPVVLDDGAIQKVAAFAACDARTVRRVVIEGKAPRSRATLAAIVMALRELGWPALARFLVQKDKGRRAA